MRLRRFITPLLVLTMCALVSIAVQEETSALVVNSHVESLQPTKVVTVIPKYGYATGPIRVRLSHSEVEIIQRLQKASTRPIINPYNATSTALFRIEPAIGLSPTIELGKKAMTAVGELLTSPLDALSNRTFIVVGRTQEFILKTLNSIGCFPEMNEIGGAFLMGATICDRQVIVINLTGYLFLKSSSQKLTTEMQTWPEPPIGATSYLIVDRNISGLAHEWVHVARSYISHGLIADNEPAWFREGLAEVISGMARVRASTSRMTYLDFHVIRLRKFANWPSSCRKSTSEYRGNSTGVSGCEYLRGAVAVELLVANYGGVESIVKLYEDMRRTGDFFASFRHIYGMTTTDFEHRADKYATYITQAATYRR